jgi:alkylation response protein AidB-like acyl-CoA dehydrogenase
MPNPDLEQEQLILDSVGRFLDREVKPHVHVLEHDDIYPAEIVEGMKALGLFGATIGADYGGLGLSASTYAKIVETVSTVWMSLAGIFNSHLIMAAAVERFGTPAQKESFLPRFATGELRGGLALTEPDCGTDLQAIRTTARRQGNQGYVINGTKTWISNGIYGQIFALLVKTRAAPPQHELFLAESSRQQEMEKLPGARPLLVAADCRSNRLIGGAKGGYNGLWAGSINASTRRAASGSPRRRRRGRSYSQIRRTFAICEARAIQLKLADMATQVEAARLLVERAAQAYDKGERCDMEAGMAKLFASEAAVTVSLESMRIHGGYGYSKEFTVERLYRDAPLLVIGEGTNELQRIIIARQLIARNKV